MVALLCLVFAILASPLKSKIRLEAENAALRHQLIVLRRQVRGRVRLTRNDRLLFVQVYRCVDPERSHRRPSRDAYRLASSRLSPLLALEITLAGRAPANRDGSTRADPADEHREPAVGRAAHPRRAA
jgi:hypothetical protein